VAIHDDRLASLARTDPLEAGLEAIGRAGAVARVAAESGLAECVDRSETYEKALAARRSPALSRSRLTTAPPPNASLRSRRELPTDAVVRIYERPDHEVATYHLLPVENRLDELWAMLDLCNPGLLGSRAGFDRRLAAPVERGGDRAAAQRLQRLTAPFVLRRDKREQAVAAELPARLERTVFKRPAIGRRRHPPARRQ